MSQSCTVTVTGKTGIAQQVTTKVISNVTRVLFDIAGNVFRVYTGGNNNNEGTLVIDVGMDSFSSIAGTVTSGVFTFTVS